MSEANSTPPIPKRLCRFPGCTRQHFAGGYCKPHDRQVKDGVPLSAISRVRRPTGTPPIINYDEVPCPNPSLIGPCHIFKGYKTEAGYGMIDVSKTWRNVRVHRYVWERDVGPIPEDRVIDHQCRNRDCINVMHLRIVTHQINILENAVGVGWQLESAKTHCPKGHPYNETNTRINKRKRACRECDRLAQRCYRARKTK